MVQPLCEYCKQMGQVTPVHGRLGVVDHIKPHNGDKTLFWDRKNWQSLCNECHDSVKRLEESRGYATGCDADGLPVDSGHPWGRGIKS